MTHSFRVPPAPDGRWSLLGWLRAQLPCVGTWWAPRCGGVIVEVIRADAVDRTVWCRAAPATWTAGEPWVPQPAQLMHVRYFNASFVPSGLVPVGAPPSQLPPGGHDER